MSIKSRLEEYCKLRHTKVGSFCRHAGISQSYFSQVKSDMGRDIQTRIRNTYPDLNVEWLRTGEGDMLNQKLEAVITPYPVEVNEVANAVTIEQPPLVPDNIVRKPEVDILEWADNADSEHTQNAFNIASILKRTRFIIKMNNSAMLPTLSQTDFLFLKPFAKGSEIIDGEIYGIETRAWGILIRHLYNDGDYILARPKNTLEYGDIRIPKKEVRNKYHIVFRGSTHLSSTPNNEAEHLKQLQRQGEHITSLIDEVVSSGKRQDRLISMLEKKQ